MNEQERLACKLCAKQNGAGCTQMFSPDPNHWICKSWLKKAESHQLVNQQPKPRFDKVFEQGLKNMNSENPVPNQQAVAKLTKDYDDSILRVLGIDDRKFFELSILQRENYVKLTKDFPKTILSTLDNNEDYVKALAEKHGYV